MDEITILYGLAAAPIIAALVSALKPWISQWVPPKGGYPAIAIILAVIWNVALTAGTEDFSRATVFLGIVVGLAASGLYSAQKDFRSQ